MSIAKEALPRPRLNVRAAEVVVAPVSTSTQVSTAVSTVVSTMPKSNRHRPGYKTEYMRKWRAKQKLLTSAPCIDTSTGTADSYTSASPSTRASALETIEAQRVGGEKS